MINYANEKYKKAQKLNTWTGKYIAKFDNVIEFGPEDIDAQFRKEHREIFAFARGDGLWLWKPYIIYQTLLGMKKGDYLFYCDSGAFFIKSIKKLATVMTNDVWVSEIPLVEKDWTKSATFQIMQAEKPSIMNTCQIQATFLLCKKTAKAVQFIKKWLDFCCNLAAIAPLEEGEKDLCISHREDQSILSVLCKLEGVRPGKDPSQWGRIPQRYQRKNALYRPNIHQETDYTPRLVLHREGVPTFDRCIRGTLQALLPYQLINVYYKLFPVVVNTAGRR